MILEQLSNARGVSGQESAVRDIIRAEVEPHVTSCRVDTIGNLICYKKGTASDGPWPRKVMLAAHMDEVGFLVSGFNADGTVRFTKVGGLDDRVLLSKELSIGEDAVPGVIGYRPIHLLSAAERSKAPDMSRAAIDIGATSEAEAKKLCKLGDQITFRVEYETLDEEDLRTVKGKAFDDRAGCAVLIELLKGEYAFDVYGTFTVQEEVGLRGARVSSYAIDPDVAIALEGTICADMPVDKDISKVTELGKGPAITFMDRSVIADQRLVKLLVGAAQENDIPYQFKKAAAGGTDAGIIHLAREGVPSTTVAIPTRFIHAPVSMLSLNDFDNTVSLLKAALANLEGGLS